MYDTNMSFKNVSWKTWEWEEEPGTDIADSTWDSSEQGELNFFLCTF